MPSTELPTAALGTMRISDPEAITRALHLGYRHLDTAQKYDNEGVVGEGIARADVPRTEVFVATKVAETNLAYDDVMRTVERSRRRLGLDAIDLLYVHWPAVTGPDDRYDPEETLPAFADLLDAGAIRHVGVANFSVDLVEEARAHLDVPLLANQVEMHPLLQQRELRAHARKNDMYVVAYCPKLQGRVDEVATLREIADAHDATPGQVSLAWLASKDDVVPIPKSSGAHLRENYEARHLNLDASDIERIDAIDREDRLVDLDKGPWNW